MLRWRMPIKPQRAWGLEVPESEGMLTACFEVKWLCKTNSSKNGKKSNKSAVIPVPRSDVQLSLATSQSMVRLRVTTTPDLGERSAENHGKHCVHSRRTSRKLASRLRISHHQTATEAKETHEGIREEEGDTRAAFGNSM